jgi:hypothetical protein
MTSPPLRILVCGGRDFADRDFVFRTLDQLTIEEGEMMPRNGTVIIHGDCPTGADRWADEWAVVNWTPVEPYPADWSALGLSAGPSRNARMLTEGCPDLVLAFPGGRGTADMIGRANKAGVPVKIAS